MESQGSPLYDLKKTADIISGLAKSQWFSICAPHGARILCGAMLIHVQCISENYKVSSAIAALKEDIHALKHLAIRFPIVHDRYSAFLKMTEALL
jgi:hypothetical protein